MDLTLSDEQRLLRESVDRFIAGTYDADHRRRVASDPLGFSPEIWKQFAELGWLALPIDEAYGGLGAGAVETGILMEAFGRGLVAEPYLATVVIGAALISECGSEPRKQAILPKVADGSLYLAFAHSERAARFDLAHVVTAARRVPDGWRLDGHKTAVLDGNAAGQIIVLCPGRRRRRHAWQTVSVPGAIRHARPLFAGLFAARRRPRLQSRSRGRSCSRRRPARRRQRRAAENRMRG
jgi:alkylation response protein AidB-like acyl-CoA dehydrogenase